LKFIGLCVFDVFDHKMQNSWPQPVLPWQPFCVPLVGGGVVVMSAL